MDFIDPTDQRLISLLERTLQATTPLAEMNAAAESVFLNVLLGIYRVSFSTLRDIYYLSQNAETGASALDLARKIMEYGISVEYMIWKGKDEKAEQFQEFMAVELHRSFEFLKSIDQDVTEHGDDTLRSGAEDYEKDYASLTKKVQERKNWAGLSVDQMLEQLHAAGQFKDFDSSRIGEAYIWGSRLNHVSPVVVRNLMGSEESRVASEFYMRQAITFALIFHFRLSTRYIDEMRFLAGENVHQELADAIVSLRDEFNTLNKRLIIVVGLPASGKSHLLDELKKKGEVGWVCHDFHANAHGNSREVMNSKYLSPLVEHLNKGISCAVADIVFCDSTRLKKFSGYIASQVSDLDVEYVYFKNNKQACIENAKRRASANLSDELGKISDLSAVYTPPSNVELVEVYREDIGAF